MCVGYKAFSFKFTLYSSLYKTFLTEFGRAALKHSLIIEFHVNSFFHSFCFTMLFSHLA